MALAPITHSKETIGAEHAESLNAAFAEIFGLCDFWPVVLTPYGGARTVAEQEKINPNISPLLSDHVKRRAVDINNQRAIRNKIGSIKFEAIMAKHGWHNMQVNGKPFPLEPWHFATHAAGHLPNPKPPIHTIENEDPMTDSIYYVSDAKAKSVKTETGHVVAALSAYYQEKPGAPLFQLNVPGKGLHANAGTELEFQAWAEHQSPTSLVMTSKTLDLAALINLRGLAASGG